MKAAITDKRNGFRMGRIGPVGALLMALAGCAHGPRPDAHHVGRIYSYVRSNHDGSEAERIHVFRASPTRIEVTKMRSRCTNAAFVTAELDLEKGQATRLTGGRLRPGATHEDFAWLEHVPGEARVAGRIILEGRAVELSAPVGGEPWHMFDFDLASLTITAQYRHPPRADFSFHLLLLWPDDEGGLRLRVLGRADARFVGEQRMDGRRVFRFDVAGPALGDQGGPIWLDADEGHVVAARWGLPNHAEYRDFALRLTRVSDGGAEEMREISLAHFRDCPDA